MATQGLISVIKNGKVILKIVAGCDGYNAPKVAEWLKHHWILSLQEIHEKCLAMDFGSVSDLVVMDETDFYFLEDDYLPPSYRETFDNPKWNPRWDYGTADNTEIIEVE